MRSVITRDDDRHRQIGSIEIAGRLRVPPLHWQGKIRGADFQPVNLSLKQIKLDKLRDAKGRPFVSIVATLQTEEQAERAIRQTTLDENTVLEWLRREPGISI